MTNAELIKALRYCKAHEACDHDASSECPYEHHWIDGEDCSIMLLGDAADALEAAEKRTAELEAQLPKEGEWQWLSSTYDRVPCEMRYVCSVCHHQEITHYDKPWKHYCPNCGAKMRGEHDGES